VQTSRTTLKPLKTVAIVIAVLSFVALVGTAPPASAASSVADVAAAPKGQWVLEANGSVQAVNGAKYYGDRGGTASGATTLIPHPNGKGYWIVDQKGVVSAHGSAKFRGDLRGLKLNAPVVGGAQTRSGKGYWLVAADGGIFAFGDAKFVGSTGNLRLNSPIVGMASTSKGNGYWIVAADGGIFAFGKAKFFGSAGGTKLARPVVGMRADTSDRGYLLVASDGGTFAYGSVKFQGSLGGLGINNIVSAAPMPKQGYVLLSSTSRLYEFPSKGAISITREQRIAEQVFDSINAERAKRGIALLRWDPSLSETAALWSANMASGGFRHTNMTELGNQLGNRYNALSENIYWGTGSLADSGSAHTSFMGSASHRDALLNTGYNSVGIGVYCTANGKLFITEQFGHLNSEGSPSFSGATSPQPVARPSTAGISCA